MRNCILPILLLLIALGQLQAQGIVRIAEYKAALDTATGADYAELLYKIGHSYYATNPDSGLYWSQRAVVAGELFNVRGAHKYPLAVGVNLEMLTRNSEALEVYFRGLRQATIVKDTAIQAAYLNNIGIVYGQMGRWDEARPYFRRALAKYEALQLPNRIAQLQNSLGNTYFETMKFDSALVYYEPAVRFALSTGEPYNIASKTVNYSMALGEVGQPDSAVYYGELAFKGFREVGHTAGEITALLNLAELSRLNGQLEAAERYALQGQAMAKEANLSFEYGVSFKNLTQIYHDMGRWRAAFFADQTRDSLEAARRDGQGIDKLARLEAQHQVEVEQIREEQLARERQAKLQAERQRRNLLIDFTVVGVLLVLFLGLIANRRVKLPPYATRIVGFLLLIITIEFIIVLLDPIFEPIVGENHLYKLSINVLIALALLPFHQLGMRYLRRYMAQEVESANP